MIEEPRGEEPDSCFVDDQGIGPDDVENPDQTLFRRLRAERHVGRAGPAGSEDSRVGFQASRGQNGDAGLIGSRSLLEPGSYSPGHLGQTRVGRFRPIQPERRSVRVGLGLPMERERQVQAHAATSR